MLTQEEKLSKFTLAINEYAQEQHDRIMREVDEAYIDQVVNRLSYKRVRHLMRFSTDPTVAVFSYLLLSGIERKDIVTIIEGVRYRVPPDDIAALITIS